MKRLLSVGATTAMVVGAALVSTPPAQAATPPSYSVMLLQPTADHPHSSAAGINDAGDVVGMSWHDGLSIDGGGQSTLWKSRTGRGVAVAPQLANANAVDISGNGDIVGGFVSGGWPYAYWYSDGTVSGITEDAVNSSVEQISENGIAALNIFDEGRLEPVIYRASSATERDELPLPSEASSPRVNGISANGKNVVGHVTHNGGSQAVLWTDGKPQVLDAPEGLESAGAWAVNDSGMAVGSLGMNKPVMWSAAGKRSELPGIPGHDTSASEINNDGTIVGGAAKGDARSPVIWLGNTVHDLNDLVPQRSGYTLVGASDINASGQIVGDALLDNGQWRGFIATPSTAETLYTAPGTHHFNGRDWKTACEPYSQTTRCRTEIIATQVQYKNGTYSRVTDWAFNNLTYNPSPRTQWSNNPLGKNGQWTANHGRKWRTECDTTNTGRNGCRSYVQARVADAVAKPTGGYTYTVETKWVFNNIVKFN